MDLRSSRSLRSPLESLSSNQRNNRDRENVDPIFSLNEGRTTRSASRKVRTLVESEDRNENLSCDSSSESNDADDRADSGTEATENQVHVSRNRKNIVGAKRLVPTKKKKLKMKNRTSIGRWERWEKFEFLRGLRRHGEGKWKKIGENIPTRSTVQVKTHAQVIMRKHKNGVNIFEELDRYEATQEARTANSNGNQKVDGNGSKVTLTSSSFLLPRLPQSKRKEQETSNAFHVEEARYSNNKPQNPQIQHAYTLPQSIGGQFETSAVTMPSLFRPVTTTTVTTRMVGNHTHPNVFHPQNQHFYGMNHPTFIQHCNPYQFTPSFDAIARATSTAAAVATSALFPTNTLQHAPMVPRPNRGMNLSSVFLMPSDEEVEAIRTLLDIRTYTENDDLQSQNRTHSEPTKMQTEENNEGIVFPV